MSHSYSFRHGKSQSTSSSSSGGHQRVSYGSRSTSTGTPPQTPTIRVTSPVPDAVGVIDIWDPEVTDDEPPQTSPKTYSFRYTEEKQHKKHKRRHSDKKQKNFAESGMQADPIEAVPAQQQQQQVEQEPPSVTTTPIEPVVAPQPKISLLDGSPIDDDGLKTAGESAEESSDCEEVSQISAVTQVPRCETERSPEAEEVMEEEPTAAEAEEKDVALIDPPIEDVDDTGVVHESTTISDAHRRWDEMHPLDGKPIKRVQFSRSLSLVPGSSAAQSATGEILADGTRGVRSGAGRRYSSMDSGACSGPPLDLFPTTFAFGEQQSSFLASGGKMLSPTPESALENAQSPQQDGDDEDSAGPRAVVPADQDGDEARQQPPQQQSCGNTMTELSVTVEEVIDEEGEDHDPTCDLFDRLNALKNDEELMDLATGFVLQLLRSAQDEALRRGHVPSKMEQKSKMSLELQHVAVPKGRNNRKWYSRLRTLLLRTLTCTCVPTHPNIQSPLSN